MNAPREPRGPLAVRRTGRWLVVDFATRHRTLGWTIVGGGLAEADGVAWLEVRNADLGPEVDAEAFARAALAAAGLAERPLFLTSCALDAWVEATAVAGDVAARCIATIGLTNRGRVGEPASAAGDGRRRGTINTLCVLSRPLADAALVEAVSIATEARTAALLAAAVPVADGDAAATGTGTDCVIVAAPLAHDRAAGGEPLRWVGLHTAAGEAIGRAVLEAVGRGVAGWIAASALALHGPGGAR
jgi:adenosylcobinamide amidohydrolase